MSDEKLEFGAAESREMEGDGTITPCPPLSPSDTSSEQDIGAAIQRVKDAVNSFESCEPQESDAEARSTPGSPDACRKSTPPAPGSSTEPEPDGPYVMGLVVVRTHGGIALLEEHLPGR